MKKVTKMSKVYEIGTLERHPAAIEGYAIMEDNYITENDWLVDKDGEEYHIIDFLYYTQNRLLYPGLMPYMNGWRDVEVSCLKLDKKVSIGTLLSVKSRHLPL